jgi:UDP-N-acetylglucosamine--N-acetylmuramyl-(pentapeptide) pyrophosphoryl-undecaprenol N-acetylglucosamine transferase
MRVAIAAGGTGGHLFPGLAVAEALYSLGHEVMVMTSEKEIDSVATAGRSEFRIERLPGMGLPRGVSLQTLQCGWRFFRGLRHCVGLFNEWRPRAVLGMGGFTSLAPILAGRFKGLPTYVHESNAIPGKANRLNARIADGLLIGLRECADRIVGASCIFTGTPVRRTLLCRPDRLEMLKRFGLDAAKRTILVMGGSQGARGINEAMVEAAGGFSRDRYQILHLSGLADEERVKEAYRKAGVSAWVGAFHHAMQEAYVVADVAVARSGAASLTELAYYRVPSVLIPYPFAAEDHQTANARVFEKAGAAVMVSEREATGERLRSELERILSGGKGEEMAKACEGLVEEKSAERVAEVLLSAVKNRGGLA